MVNIICGLFVLGTFIYMMIENLDTPDTSGPPDTCDHGGPFCPDTPIDPRDCKI